MPPKLRRRSPKSVPAGGGADACGLVGGDAAERDATDATRFHAGASGVGDGDGTAPDRGHATAYAPSIRFSANSAPPGLGCATGRTRFFADTVRRASRAWPAADGRSTLPCHPEHGGRASTWKRAKAARGAPSQVARGETRAAAAGRLRRRRAAAGMPLRRRAEGSPKPIAPSGAPAGGGEVQRAQGVARHKSRRAGRLVTDFAERDAKKAQTGYAGRGEAALVGAGLGGTPPAPTAGGSTAGGAARSPTPSATPRRSGCARCSAHHLRLARVIHHEARRADPHASQRRRQRSPLRRRESTVPGVAQARAREAVQADASAAIEAERARVRRGERGVAGARDAGAHDRVRAERPGDAAIGQRRMVLGALRAEDEAMARRKESFINRLAQMNKELRRRSATKTRRQSCPCFSKLLGAFITARDRSARTRSQDHHLKACEIIPDVTPEGLIEGLNRAARRSRARRAACARRVDALLRSGTSC